MRHTGATAFETRRLLCRRVMPGGAFSHTDLAKLEAYHRKENSRSGRVLARSSMSVTDTVERFARAGLLPKGEVCYCVRREWPEAVGTGKKGGRLGWHLSR